MTVDPASTRDIVCVAGGTGLAPIKAIIDEIGQTNRTRWVHLFFGARDREDLYDLDDLMQLTTRYPWLTVTPVTSEDPTYPGERGQRQRCDGRLRTMERPRRVRLRIARHGPGDAAAAVRDPGPINPYQVRRLRRPVIKPLTKPVTEPMTIAMTEPLTEPCSHPVTSERWRAMRPIVMTINGSDPTGQTGIAADLAVFRTHGWRHSGRGHGGARAVRALSAADDGGGRRTLGRVARVGAGSGEAGPRCHRGKSRVPSRRTCATVCRTSSSTRSSMRGSAIIAVSSRRCFG